VSEQQSSSVQTAKAILDAFNAHDLDRIMGFFADDCLSGHARGPDEWAATGRKGRRERGPGGAPQGTPGCALWRARHWGSGNMVASEWLLTGTNLEARESRSAAATTTSFVMGRSFARTRTGRSSRSRETNAGQPYSLERPAAHTLKHVRHQG